jgi:hypothetical protein
MFLDRYEQVNLSKYTRTGGFVATVVVFENLAPAPALYQRSPFMRRLEERVPWRSTGASNGKARDSVPGLPVEAERRINYMIMLLVDLLLFGSVTVIIVWRRKGRR